MKKEVKKYAAIVSLTEDDIKATGFNRWIKKHLYTAFIWFAIGIVVVALNTWFDNVLTRIIVYVTFIGWFIWFFINCYKTGKAFYNKVKDLPEPIDLREIK